MAATANQVEPVKRRTSPARAFELADGFTLLEVLMALAVLAAVSAALLAGRAAMRRATDVVERMDEGALTADLVAALVWRGVGAEEIRDQMPSNWMVDLSTVPVAEGEGSRGIWTRAALAQTNQAAAGIVLYWRACNQGSIVADKGSTRGIHRND